MVCLKTSSSRTSSRSLRVSLAVLLVDLLTLIMMMLHERPLPNHAGEEVFVDAADLPQLGLYQGEELVFELLVAVEVNSPRVFSHFCKSICELVTNLVESTVGRLRLSKEKIRAGRIGFFRRNLRQNQVSGTQR